MVRISLLTAGAIIVFRIINLLVIYRHLKLDYVLCLVAVCFLVIGLLLNRPAGAAKFVAAAKSAEPAQPLNILAVLTSRELLILRLLAEGMTNQEIASAQFIERSTVKTHVNNIYTKLSVASRKEARAKYAEMARIFPVS
jgi:DNA-binding NarL/FixJ family response regulator